MITALVVLGILLALYAMAQTKFWPALCLIACYLVGGLTMVAMFSASLILVTILLRGFGPRGPGHA